MNSNLNSEKVTGITNIDRGHGPIGKDTGQE